MLVVQQTFQGVRSGDLRSIRRPSATCAKEQQIRLRIDGIAKNGEAEKTWGDALRTFAPLRARHQEALEQSEKWTLLVGLVTLPIIAVVRLAILIGGALASRNPADLDITAGFGPVGLAVTAALFVLVLSTVLCAAWVSVWEWLSNWGISKKASLLAEFVPPLVAFGVAHIGKLFAPEPLHEQQHWLLCGALEGSLLVGFMYCGLLVTANVGRIAYCVISNSHRRRYPDLYLPYAIFRALERVAADSSASQTWKKIEVRASLIADLEDAAYCLELIPTRIKALDDDSADWERNVYRRRASAIRGLKKWVLLPKIDTRFQLDSELRRILRIVCETNWDALPDAETVPGKSASFWTRMFSVARTLSIAVTPLIAIFAVRTHLWAVPDNVFNYLVSVSILWFVVGALPLVDPRFTERLSSFKELSTFIPFVSKKE